jgi:hypothetical protein
MKNLAHFKCGTRMVDSLEYLLHDILCMVELHIDAHPPKSVCLGKQCLQRASFAILVATTSDRFITAAFSELLTMTSCNQLSPMHSSFSATSLNLPRKVSASSTLLILMHSATLRARSAKYRQSFAYSTAVVMFCSSSAPRETG